MRPSTGSTETRCNDRHTHAATRALFPDADPLPSTTFEDTIAAADNAYNNDNPGSTRSSTIYAFDILNTTGDTFLVIGAGGALEFLIGMKALAEGVAPPVLNHLGPDPDCDVPLALEAQAIDCDTLVSNSFAFGGLNAVLVGKVMQ